jgi:chemotaxis protein CheY-P-specific phosphatase CheC
MEVRPIPGPGISEREAGILVGRVQITGAWLGTVLLRCPEELANKVARVMFGPDSEGPRREESRDALAEITNMTAGNLKSLVGRHCHLSMPQVTDRVLDPAIAPEDAELARQVFECQGELFVVTVLAGEDNRRSG